MKEIVPAKRSSDVPFPHLIRIERDEQKFYTWVTVRFFQKYELKYGNLMEARDFFNNLEKVSFGGDAIGINCGNDFDRVAKSLFTQASITLVLLFVKGL